MTDTQPAKRQPLRLLTGVALLILGALVIFYGLFAIVYGGDSGGSGDPDVTVAGHVMDADVFGTIALLIGLCAILFSTMLLRRD